MRCMLHSLFLRRHALIPALARFLTPRTFSICLCAVAAILLGSQVSGQDLAAEQMKGLSWRLIGPHRGGASPLWLALRAIRKLIIWARRGAACGRPRTVG